MGVISVVNVERATWPSAALLRHLRNAAAYADHFEVATNEAGKLTIIRWGPEGRHKAMAFMTETATPTDQGCIFCAIVTRRAGASVVYQAEHVVVFMLA